MRAYGKETLEHGTRISAQRFRRNFPKWWVQALEAVLLSAIPKLSFQVTLVSASRKTAWLLSYTWRRLDLHLWWLDLIISEVFSDLHDSVVLWFLNSSSTEVTRAQRGRKTWSSDTSSQATDINTIPNSQQQNSEQWHSGKQSSKLSESQRMQPQRIQECKSRENAFAIADFPCTDHQYSV